MGETVVKKWLVSRCATRNRRPALIGDALVPCLTQLGGWKRRFGKSLKKFAIEIVEQGGNRGVSINDYSCSFRTEFEISTRCAPSYQLISTTDILDITATTCGD